MGDKARADERLDDGMTVQVYQQIMSSISSLVNPSEQGLALLVFTGLVKCPESLGPACLRWLKQLVAPKPQHRAPANTPTLDAVRAELERTQSLAKDQQPNTARGKSSSAEGTYPPGTVPQALPHHIANIICDSPTAKMAPRVSGRDSYFPPREDPRPGEIGRWPGARDGGLGQIVELHRGHPLWPELLRSLVADPSYRVKAVHEPSFRLNPLAVSDIVELEVKIQTRYAKVMTTIYDILDLKEVQYERFPTELQLERLDLEQEMLQKQEEGKKLQVHKYQRLRYLRNRTRNFARLMEGASAMTGVPWWDWRKQGAGCRLVHIPTGIVVENKRSSTFSENRWQCETVMATKLRVAHELIEKGDARGLVALGCTIDPRRLIEGHLIAMGGREGGAPNSSGGLHLAPRNGV